MQKLVLKKGEERRLHAGHLWVFSNEIDARASPLNEYGAGEDVQVVSHRGEFLGKAYVNPHSLIAARLYSRIKGCVLDESVILEKLQDALRLRNTCYSEPFYRLVHGEGDFLPGLIIDRYDDIAVLQLNTAGMECRRDAIVNAIQALLSPTVIHVRNDSAVRNLENLPTETETICGVLPEIIQLRENDLSFTASVGKGQKTGWFFDHRENRRWLQRLSNDKSVLDVFSYLGGWAMNAAAGGAKDVTLIDASQPALELAQENATLNGFEGRFSALAGDAVEILRGLQSEDRQFDIVVLDPPAYIKRKKDHRAGLRQYELINRLAASLITPGGLLISASCSQHLKPEELKTAMLRGVRKNRREMQLLKQGGQGPDHPINAAMPETNYLKAYCGRLS